MAGIASWKRKKQSCRSGFSLVELLTVIFIIALLIGILIPSLNAARNAAKKTTSKTVLNTLAVGLDLFKNDNGSDFPQTNGFPPSFAHPPLTSFGYSFEAWRGQFPYIETNPIVYGAHWLPAMLMGVDHLGFIKKSAVPKRTPPLEPWKWYTLDGKVTERAPLYVTPDNAPTKKTENLPGRQPENNSDLFTNWDKMKHLPVFTDAWDQTILYYAANTNGRTTNMVEEKHNDQNSYQGASEQGQGPPFYFHEDNEGFTGTSDEANVSAGTAGWDFSSSGGYHPIAFHGAALTPADLLQQENHGSFARYIVDRKIYTDIARTNELQQQVDPKLPLRPVNAQSYLLISPGLDGKYGTRDDVSNIPAFPDE